MSRVRVYTTVEVDRRKHVATPVPPPPGLNAAWMVVIARADGTEPVVLCEADGLVHCTCKTGQRGDYCVHLKALRKVGALAEKQAGLMTRFKSFLGLSAPRQVFALAAPAEPVAASS